VEAALLPLGEFIIDNLDEDGYLRTSLAELSERAPASIRAASPPPTPEQWERALNAVQLFLEPAGVGARDARECLLLQLDAIEDGELMDGWESIKDREQTVSAARTIASTYLDDLMNNRLPKIADRSGL